MDNTCIGKNTFGETDAHSRKPELSANWSSGTSLPQSPCDASGICCGGKHALTLGVCQSSLPFWSPLAARSHQTAPGVSHGLQSLCAICDNTHSGDFGVTLRGAQ
eukprot:4617367-Amphidinium_carterae.1